MKLNFPFCIALLVCCFSSLGFGQIWGTAEKTSQVADPTVVAVTADIEIDFGEMADMIGLDEPVVKNTMSSTGIIIHLNGGVVVPTASIEPPAMPMMGPQGGPEAQRVGLKVRLQDGTAFDADVVAEDKSLGLSFLQIKPNRTGMFRSLGTTSVAPLALGDELLAFDRLTQNYGNALRTTKINVAGTLKKPVAGYLQQGAMAPGSAVFNQQGRFVGMTIMAPMISTDDDNPLAGLTGPGPQSATMILISAKSINDKLPKSMMAAKKKPAPAEPITDPSFLSADGDKDGSLTAKEFKAYASSRLSGQSDEFFARLFKLVDTDASESLNISEFKKRMAAVRKAQDGEGGEDETPAKAEEEPKKPRRQAPKERDLNNKEADYDAVARRAAPRDAFPVFDNPKLSKAKDAKTAADEVVIGVVVDGEARAYPISIMGVHELGNDICGKTPIAVSW